LHYSSNLKDNILITSPAFAIEIFPVSRFPPLETSERLFIIGQKQRLHGSFPAPAGLTVQKSPNFQESLKLCLFSIDTTLWITDRLVGLNMENA
jgi:hypothetical protein